MTIRLKYRILEAVKRINESKLRSATYDEIALCIPDQKYTTIERRVRKLEEQGELIRAPKREAGFVVPSREKVNTLAKWCV